MGHFLKKEKKEMTEIREEKEQTNEVEQEVEQEQTEGVGKGSRGSKKFTKALTKMGMKEVKGTNRVTLRTNKNFVLYVDEPTMLKNGENAWVIFGEAKFLDFTGNLAGEKAQNFQKAEEAKTEEVVEAEGEEEDAGDIPEDKISTLMEYSNCTKAKAIRALKKTGGDVVEAITLAS